jgi:hypothetical protein
VLQLFAAEPLSEAPLGARQALHVFRAVQVDDSTATEKQRWHAEEPVHNQTAALLKFLHGSLYKCRQVDLEPASILRGTSYNGNTAGLATTALPASAVESRHLDKWNSKLSTAIPDTMYMKRSEVGCHVHSATMVAAGSQPLQQHHPHIT